MLRSSLLKVIIFCILFLHTLLNASSYPNKPLTIIVPFGKGGSTDRLARTMKPFLEEELGQRINVVNKKGQGTLFGTKNFLKSSQDGYTLLVSSFSPYIPNTILANNAPYQISDFDILNIQWVDFEFIATSHHASYSTLLELVDTIKRTKKALKVAVLYRSTGYLIVKLLMEKFNIQKNKVEFVFFHGGKVAREALITKDVDFIVISAQGSEKYREFIKPIAIIKEKGSNRWDAPTINEALQGTTISFPIFRGSMRGFAVSKEFKKNHPMRYHALTKALRRVIAKKKVQQQLKRHKIGASWIGAQKSNELLRDSFELFKDYNYLYETNR